MNPNRVAKGQPTGGQFAEQAKTDSDVDSLASESVQQITRGPGAPDVWTKDDVLHRADGPAVTWADGTEFWWYEGHLHRADGPSTIWPNGRYEWHIHGEEITGGQQGLTTDDPASLPWNQPGNKGFWVGGERTPLRRPPEGNYAISSGPQGFESPHTEHISYLSRADVSAERRSGAEFVLVHQTFNADGTERSTISTPVEPSSKPLRESLDEFHKVYSDRVIYTQYT